MSASKERAVAIVGVGAVLPDALNVDAFWKNLLAARYSISEVKAERWDPELYYDADPRTPDKTYSKIGGWCRDYEWNPFAWKLPVPPKVADSMDVAQKWAISCTRAALEDHAKRGGTLDRERTAVILGNAMAGERHYLTSMRLQLPEVERMLQGTPSFCALDESARRRVLDELRTVTRASFPEITEDTMPGELANCIAGRLANLFDFHGPNYVVDAACASAMAAIAASVEGLIEHDFDAVIAGGIDRNMGVSTFIKFCKIGALSATGTRPYGDGADGFVMGEGAALFVLKRLEDAERGGERIYAVIRGIGGASDGKGKGITAPNPQGQRLAIERAWRHAGCDPVTATYVEGHGTSTRVGDVVELESLQHVFGAAGARPGSIALGSVKSNIGHLKGAAGAAGVLKTALALEAKVIPPSLNARRPNPSFEFGSSSFTVSHDAIEWRRPANAPRRAGVSAFGFGGTNFHVVLEEHAPELWPGGGGGRRERVAVPTLPPAATVRPVVEARAALRGAFVTGAADTAGLREEVGRGLAAAKRGDVPAPALPEARALAAPERLAIDFGSAEELVAKLERAQRALEADAPPAWRALSGQGVHRGRGAKQPVAFLYTGQGSQYVNMLAELRSKEALVAATFDEADRVMTPLLGRPLTEIIFVDPRDEAAVAAANEQLTQTAITQPAVLAVDIALTRVLASFGIAPDVVMGHSLGEYGALVAAEGLGFAAALEAVSARGREMTRIAVADNGKMAAVLAPIPEIEAVLAETSGYAVIANVNSSAQAVIGGASAAVVEACRRLEERGYRCIPLNVSHAFHTEIVAPASGPLRETLARLDLRKPARPIISNVTGELYPTNGDVREAMLDLLARQVASPVLFSKGLERLYEMGVRTFVELGPKSALKGFVDDVLGARGDVASLFTNHPKLGDVVSLGQSLCGLWAAGHGSSRIERASEVAARPQPAASTSDPSAVQTATIPAPPLLERKSAMSPEAERYEQLGRLFASFLDESRRIFGGAEPRATDVPVVISGAGLGLPGTDHVFDDANVGRILAGEQFIKPIDPEYRRRIVDKHVTRLVKRADGDPTFETIDDEGEVMKLAGQARAFDLANEFGVDPDRVGALDAATRLAIGAGLDALRDAGLPLLRTYRQTSKGTLLPDRWRLPESMRDDTGVIFASAFPGLDAFAKDLREAERDQARRREHASLSQTLAVLRSQSPVPAHAIADVEARLRAVEAELAAEPHGFDRRFLFRVLAMGHSQFAEEIGARGPNTQVNAACASTTQAIGLAEDWIRLGRCRRVIIVSADDVTSERLLEWIGAGFLATGAAATDERVEDAALPFDRRRHGMLLGMGAAALVIERADAVSERGMRPICEVLAANSANSAFHGTRLDVEHIKHVMEALVATAESRWGIDRREMARETVFISHETYTPARGGSAAAEVEALRHVFGPHASEIVVANTKGFTGHPMGVGIEDVVAVKALETGIVPPVPNFREVDPELGLLNLSRGGSYGVRYALRLAAGFGSQISFSLLRWSPSPTGARTAVSALGYQSRVADPMRFAAWLSNVTGQPGAVLEVASRRLRVVESARAAARVEAPKASVAAAPSAPPARAAVPVVAAPVAVPASAPVTGIATVQESVLALVARATGYPAEMLDPELDLEADLGIDTVKQAEVFAAIREEYGIERDPNLKLRDFPTLGHVVGFVLDRRPDLAKAAAAPRPTVATAPVAGAAPQRMPSALTTAGGADAVHARILEIVARATGYPQDMLEPELDLEADLGIDTVKQAEVFAAVREAYGIERDPNLKLRDFPTLGHVIAFAKERAGLAAAPAAASVTAGEPASAAAAGASPAGASAGAGILDRVLAIVARTTGYPSEMLDPELDLEADLGIDTVKQAEIFATLRAEYGFERDANLKLRDFPTLASVAEFVRAKLGVAEIARTPAANASPTPPPVPAIAPAIAAETPATLPAGDSVLASVLAIVARTTGYPAEMLDPELDLEADLGIDTVKQAEIFATLRSEYGFERDPNLKLRDFPTLASVAEFVRARTGAVPAAPSSAAPAVTDARDAVVESFVDVPQGDMDASNALPRRVPVPMWRPPLDLCKRTAVELGEGDRVIVAMDAGRVGSALAQRLQKRGVTVLALEADTETDALLAQIDTWRAEGPIRGLYWLRALDPHAAIEEMTADEWSLATQRVVKHLHRTIHALSDALSDSGTFLVAATRLGGLHGYGAAGAESPLGGAVVGFVKAFKRERAAVLCKVVDFEAGRRTAEPAERLIEETLRDPGAVEIGIHGGVRFGVGLKEIPVDGTTTDLALGPDSVFVVTGAAGSIVSAIVADLARATQGTFHLLDLAAPPDPNDPDLAAFGRDREGLKRAIFDRLRDAGEKATPARIERELARLERAHAALAAMRTVEACSGQVFYHQVDLTQAEAVERVMADVLARHERVDVLVHAAGIEISRMVQDKDAREYDLVFDVKSIGWHAMMRALRDAPLRAAVVFSSVAGRFGNGGQTDYSAANDLLCKCMLALPRQRPGARGIAIDWTAWAGIGMATRGSIPRMMELAGIDMLPPEAGIPIVRRELTCGPSVPELVVGDRLGILVEPFDETGGIDVSVLSHSLRGPMVDGDVVLGVDGVLTVRTLLDPARQPFLRDHAIDGTPVLPGVMGLEAFAEIASLLLPGWDVESIDDVTFHAPFKFYRSEPREVILRAEVVAANGAIHVECALQGVREIAGRHKPQTTNHFTARVTLAQARSAAPSIDVPQRPVDRPEVDAEQVYRIYFHGPAYKVLDRAWSTAPGEASALMASDLPANHEPRERPLLVAPRHIELCFQTAGLYEMGTTGRLALPRSVGRLQCYADPALAEGALFSRVRRQPEGGGFDAVVVDETGRVFLELNDYRAIELAGLTEKETLAPIEKAMNGRDEHSN